MFLVTVMELGQQNHPVIMLLRGDLSLNNPAQYVKILTDWEENIV